MSEELTPEIIGGKNPVLEALRADRDVNKIWIAEGVQKKWLTELLQLAKEKGLLVQFVPKKKIYI